MKLGLIGCVCVVREDNELVTYVANADDMGADAAMAAAICQYDPFQLAAIDCDAAE